MPKLWLPQEEHAEYVRSMATLSAFIAGFVNVAFVQFNFDATKVPRAVLFGFAVTNALTVSTALAYQSLALKAQQKYHPAACIAQVNRVNLDDKCLQLFSL